MKFKIMNQIFATFPDLCVGVVVGKGINNFNVTDEVQEGLRNQERKIREKYNIENLSQSPNIDVWRKAYSTFGAKPKENLCSVENLYRLVLKGREIRRINTLVDIYNVISLKYMVPVGGEDLDKVQGDIQLTYAGENEPPVALLGDKEPSPPRSGEVIYKDDISSICRRWNWREADRTKLTEETKNCILVIEGLLPVTNKEIAEAIVELKHMIEKYCGGLIVCNVLSKNNAEVEI